LNTYIHTCIKHTRTSASHLLHCLRIARFICQAGVHNFSLYQSEFV